jgi:hypothetical protein
MNRYSLQLYDRYRLVLLIPFKMIHSFHLLLLPLQTETFVHLRAYIVAYRNDRVRLFRRLYRLHVCMVLEYRSAIFRQHKNKLISIKQVKKSM